MSFPEQKSNPTNLRDDERSQSSYLMQVQFHRHLSFLDRAIFFLKLGQHHIYNLTELRFSIKALSLGIQIALQMAV